jgi:pimeloyl-ACP methyl ester carboxylesterase
MIAAGSLLGGLVAAIALVALPFAGADEHAITAAVLLGFAFGWLLLALLSARFGDRPQRWAAVPAAAMGLAGLGLLVLAPGAATLGALGWVWPAPLLALVVWMTLQVRRQPRSRTRPLVLYPLFAVLALVAVGGAFETVADSTDRATASAAGDRLVDVGSHRLHIRCTGTGSPTVVLEPGLGESAKAMSRWIGPDVARTTRVCVYDQAGHGASEAAPGDHADAARDLHVLLERAGVGGPYVVAGHSLGGMVALTFAGRYPRQVAGVVLLDSMHPKQTSSLDGMDSVLALVPSLARTGLARLFFDPKEGNPAGQAQQFVRDVAQMPAELSRAAAVTSLGRRPLAVVTAGRDRQPGWIEHQDQLARLSTDSVHRIVPGSTHTSLIDDRADAAASGRAIAEVVNAVRSARPLR